MHIHKYTHIVYKRTHIEHLCVLGLGLSQSVFCVSGWLCMHSLWFRSSWSEAQRNSCGGFRAWSSENVVWVHTAVEQDGRNPREFISPEPKKHMNINCSKSLEILDFPKIRKFSTSLNFFENRDFQKVYAYVLFGLPIVTCRISPLDHLRQGRRPGLRLDDLLLLAVDGEASGLSSPVATHTGHWSLIVLASNCPRV